MLIVNKNLIDLYEKPMNKNFDVAIVGSNFGLNGYLPVINNLKNCKIKYICSPNIHSKSKKIKKNYDVNLTNNWRKIFEDKFVDLIICAVPPKVQEKILIFNLRYKKKIIFEKPITSNLNNSLSIVKSMKRLKIKGQINLIFLNHPLFLETKKIIRNKSLGKILNYEIYWNFVSQDLNNKVKSWKTDEAKGGGIKNIFLTHVLTYCEYFFGKNRLIRHKFKLTKFKKIRYKNNIECHLSNPKAVSGKIKIFTKKNGFQEHVIKIYFEKGYINLSTKSKDWTRNFKLKIKKYDSKKNIIKKNLNNRDYKDGRSELINLLIANFLKKSNYNHINYCLNAEKINKNIN